MRLDNQNHKLIVIADNKYPKALVEHGAQRFKIHSIQSLKITGNTQMNEQITVIKLFISIIIIAPTKKKEGIGEGIL